MVKHYLFATLLLAGSLLWQPAYAAPCEAETHTETTTEESTDYSDDIELSEIYPIPDSDEEEFIELYNAGDTAIDLREWFIADASNKTYVIAEEDFVSTIIDAGDYFVIPHSVSKIYLNNGGDAVSLYSPDESLVDATTYDSGDNQHAWVYLAGEWSWTNNSTEGIANSPSTINSDEEENDSDSENEATESSVAQETSTAILLSELLPNPEGVDSTDEWIEIVNTSDEAVYLDGWSLTDEKNYYTIEDLTIASGEYISFEVGDTQISLNNSGDTVFLIDPFGSIINGTTYESAIEGSSWAMFDGSWEWSAELTPGEENMRTESVTESTEENETIDASNEETETDVVSIDLFRSLEDKTTATISGVVSVLPGTFGSQYFYMQDESAGIQVYSYSKAFPDMEIGDRIQVTGEKSVARGETRIKVTAIENISVIESGISLLPRDTSTLDESLEGVLVQIEGEIVEASSKEALIDDLVQLVFKKSANVDTDLLEEGTSVTVLGIVTQYDDEYRVQPRSSDDIQTEEADEIAWVNSAEAASPENPETFSAEPASTNSNGQLFAIIGFIVLAIGGIAWTRIQPLLQKKNVTTTSATEKLDATTNSKSIFEQLRKNDST